MKNKQKRKTHRWIWFVHEISSTMNSPWMQNKKISVQCFFCVSNGRSSSTRRAHSPPRGKPFNKNKGGEGAGGGGVWINQIHVTTMALDSSGLLFFWSGEIIPGSSAHWTRTRTKKNTTAAAQCTVKGHELFSPERSNLWALPAPRSTQRVPQTQKQRRWPIPSLPWKWKTNRASVDVNSFKLIQMETYNEGTASTQRAIGDQFHSDEMIATCLIDHERVRLHGRSWIVKCVRILSGFSL